MSNYLSGFIQRIFVRYFSITKPPQSECISFYIGKSSKEIINLHKNSIVDNQFSLIEIRLDNATLTCEMYQDVCVDARLFRDKELICDPVLFKSNQLKN